MVRNTSVLPTLQSMQKAYITVEARVATLKMFETLLHLDSATTRTIERTVALANYAQPVMYVESAKRLCFNLQQNPGLLDEYPPDKLCTLSDEMMARGTILQRQRDQERSRMVAIENMLKEKYDDVTKQSGSAGLIRCRVCGSSDISWDQKQTRGADEAMTIFCTCTRCKTRWKI